MGRPMRLCPEGCAGRPCESRAVGYGGHETAPTEELPRPFRWMVRGKVPRSVPRLLSCLKRYHNRSSDGSSAGSSAFSGVTSGDGSSGTSVGAMATIRAATKCHQPFCPQDFGVIVDECTDLPQSRTSA